MIPCCCDRFWRTVEGEDEEYPNRRSSGQRTKKVPYHVKYFLYVVLVFWIGFVLWRIDRERQAAEAYKRGEGFYTTSIIETVADNLKRQEAHIIISYVVIPFSIPLMLFMLYRIIRVEIDDKSECPLGYKEGDFPQGETSGEAFVKFMKNSNSSEGDGKMPFNYDAAPSKTPFKYDEDPSIYEYTPEEILEMEKESENEAVIPPLDMSSTVERVPPPLPPYPEKLRKRGMNSKKNN
mmetsp:Transcript_27373/g.48398  ORF Transcript_27373/g.48398 Transcript_27373/m.48398 type:complete len:236 (+) Transcript_27373:114-821(+)|eukprot:CAMPEP_0197521176 /NCGR_PEP_ID=MMETSP1318-20131121/6460_1 /TAXON_ID=552666 /ORGANISM="Partenskyella glossopodia, Strain RCC365" /LENGTH=235 /DNA_ID=CAMNT_0043073043 /DNA_START=24 /DNA_END=731 /DNA_ORIENTATION=-